MKTHFTFFLMLYIALVQTTICANAQNKIALKDSLALVDLYNNTNGPQWFNNSNWLTTARISTWWGISTIGNRVTIISLEANNLAGDIPPSIGNLDSLKQLVLYNNSLSRIPAKIGKLSKLFYINLENCDLTGSIPAAFGNLTSLKECILSINKLSGKIPATIGDLNNLTYLSLWNNQLSGAIPEQIGNLASLQELLLDHNQLSGQLPAAIGDLINLRSLYLNYNLLTGQIPATLQNLTGLHSLALNNNRFRGPLPPEIGLITGIPVYINDNRLNFDGLEMLDDAYFFYSPQANIPIHINGNSLSVSAGGTLANNTYTWYNVGTQQSVTIQGDSVFYPAQNGRYTVEVVNSLVPGLMLSGNTVLYAAALTTATANTNASANALRSNMFSVYPNPATNVLHVKTTGKEVFSLSDQSGKTIFTKTIDGNTDINISHLPSGTYYLKNVATGEAKTVLITQ